jgi:hypothetical protein
VILAAGTVSTEVLYLANKGDTSIAWSAACASFGGFCHKALISTVITFVAVIFYAALSLVSSYKLFSKYDAPVVTQSGEGIKTVTLGSPPPPPPPSNLHLHLHAKLACPAHNNSPN